jgi:hypothetical protein
LVTDHQALNLVLKGWMAAGGVEEVMVGQEVQVEWGGQGVVQVVRGVV